MSIGRRILELRKSLNITQEDFSKRLKINKGTISNLEKDRQKPSEQLLHHICLEYFVSENWLKTGEGEMFISPEEVIKKQMARLGERTVIDAFNNIMKEHGLAMADCWPANRSDTSNPEIGFTVLNRRSYDKDPELKRMVDALHIIFSAGDEKLKNWASVQFDIAFPRHVIEEAQKKQKEPHEQTFAG